ncbi:hypothetical protein DAT35_51440 [Vitiosangium sp. GDMCC 1.1324]|nr:hypothetical protein DAT35_51440 [Vitiosangium sp. GDMCC 1.1324]
MWTPLRFPGQYHDPETDLFENWNRYYDPTTGRYLQPEPLIQQAYTLKSDALSGSVPATYTYAQANPINETDSSGLFSTDGKCDELTEKLKGGAECKEQAKKITNECLRNCVINQCDSIKVICNPNEEDGKQCKKKGVLGAAPQMLRELLRCEVKANGRMHPGTEVVWCKKNLLRNEDRCTIEGLVHEMAHSCGMRHDDDGGDPAFNEGVPGHEGNGLENCPIFGE